MNKQAREKLMITSSSTMDGSNPSTTRFNCCLGATKYNLFPKDWEVQLDANGLKSLGLTQDRMVKCDALFFYQLLLPLIDPKHTGVKDNPRMGYYEQVATHTNLYAIGM